MGDERRPTQVSRDCVSAWFTCQPATYRRGVWRLSSSQGGQYFPGKKHAFLPISFRAGKQVDVKLELPRARPATAPSHIHITLSQQRLRVRNVETGRKA